MTPLVFVVDALAGYRFTRLITDDHLPFGPLRDRVVDTKRDSLVAEWMECPWCAGMWVAAGVAAARAWAPRWWDPAATVLALSAVAGLLSTWEHRD